MKKFIKIFLWMMIFSMYINNVLANTISYWSTSWITSCPIGWELIDSEKSKTWLGASWTLTCQKVTPKLGINYWNSFDYEENSWNRYCPDGQELLDIHKQSYPWLSWTFNCIKIDNDPPVINVNLNWYVNNTWINQDVKLTVSVSDNWTWIKKVRYKVNGTEYEWSANFDIDFSREWIYNVEITAEDSTTHESLYWNLNSTWNISKVNYVVKIDKSSPALLWFSSSDTVNWIKEKPVVSYKIVDTYEWKSIEQKLFVCTWKPANSEWLAPVESNGNLVWVCDPNASDCSLDNNFIPSPYHPTMWCRWACSWWYTKWEDDNCYLTTTVRTCTGLRLWIYSYNKNDQSVKENNNVSSFWDKPIWVMMNWEFITNFNPSTLWYTPYLSQCEQKCYPGTVEEFGNCVKDKAIVCCQSSYPLWTYINSWAEVDCSLPVNATHVSCVYNNYCGWYVKDVLKEWDYSLNKWQYTDGTVPKDTLADLCWVVPIENSNWFTCNPRYYLLNWWTASQKCEVVPIWQFSWQSNTKWNCENKPSNSTYTTNWTTKNDCEWVCNSWYHEQWWSCISSTRNRNCNSKPNNTTWNSVSNITQTWDWSDWVPTRTPVYAETASTTQCRFKCSWSRVWNWNACVNSTVDWLCWMANWTWTETYPMIWFCSAWTKADVDTSWTDWTYNWRCDWGWSWVDVSCSAPKIIYTYSWNIPSWSSCSVSCWWWTQTRAVTCQRNDGVTVSDSYCTISKPSTSQTCNPWVCTPSCTLNAILNCTIN